MNHSFVESKFFKDDHDRLVGKMERSLEAIKTRKTKYDDVPSLGVKSLRYKNTER